MMNKIKIYTLFILFISFGEFLFGQEELKRQEQLKVYKFFENNTPEKNILDTSKIYAFAFKAVVKKNANGEARVISFTANDSIAYSLYPNYKLLKNINYGVFMRNRNRAIFIFPVILDVWKQEWPEQNRKPNYDEVAMSMFSLPRDPYIDIENWIYFTPHILRMDLTVRF